MIVIAGFSPASASEFDKLLATVDAAIDSFPMHVAHYEQQIDEARNRYWASTSPSGRYDGALQLYRLYLPFQSDSAIRYINECIAIARQRGDVSQLVESQSRVSIMFSKIGLYDEAKMALDSVRVTPNLSQSALGEYYHARNLLNNELAYYARTPQLRNHYLQLALPDEEKVLQYLPADDSYSMMRRELSAQNDSNRDRSMQINDEWLKTVKAGSHPYAMVALYRYIEYKQRGDTAQMMHWLGESVLADIRNGIMDQGSIWELANELMLNGDIERASRYILFTSECAMKFGSRQRNWQISPLLTDIAERYKARSEHRTNQFKLMLAIISGLSLLLLGLLVFLHRRNRQLSTARQALHETNDQLLQLNNELKSTNNQLQDANGRFAIVNSQLAETNRVKEEYIGRFLSLCAQYVTKIDDYRKMVNKKLKNKEINELLNLTRSTELKERELDELYQNFDSVFLHLFPNFVDDFNALLTPEAQIHPKSEHRLTTDLRIVALIRLGIEDSSKIAEFLHYSVNTIYNYRARLKNGAIGNREDFERQVKELGRPH